MQRVLGIGHDDALGDLELERARVAAALAERMVEILDQAEVCELLGREIDSNTWQRQSACPPACQVGADLFEYPVAERADQAHLLGHEDEVPRQQHAPL